MDDGFKRLSWYVKHFDCGECGKPLVLRWAKDHYEISCSVKEHQGYKRKPTLAQECQQREEAMVQRKVDVGNITVDDLFK